MEWKVSVHTKPHRISVYSVVSPYKDSPLLTLSDSQGSDNYLGGIMSIRSISIPKTNSIEEAKLILIETYKETIMELMEY